MELAKLQIKHIWAWDSHTSLWSVEATQLRGIPTAGKDWYQVNRVLHCILDIFMSMVQLNTPLFSNEIESLPELRSDKAIWQVNFRENGIFAKRIPFDAAVNGWKWRSHWTKTHKSVYRGPSLYVTWTKLTVWGIHCIERYAILTHWRHVAYLFQNRFS